MRALLARKKFFRIVRFFLKIFARSRANGAMRACFNIDSRAVKARINRSRAVIESPKLDIIPPARD
jgi:hypothetical protein